MCKIFFCLKVDFCKMELEHEATKLIFKFQYKQDMTVMRSLNLIDMECLQVVYSSEECPVELNASAQLVSQLLANFQMSDTDLTIEILRNKAVLKNYDSG